METLRGIFPQPKEPPKRDFVKENVKRMKDIQQATRRSVAANGTPAKRIANRTSYSSVKPTISKALIVIKEASKTFDKGGSAASLAATCSSVESAASRSSVVSTTREMSSQTTDVNDELFLKDVIIRIPSARVMDQMNSNDENEVAASLGSKTVSKRNEKPVAFKRIPAGTGGGQRKPLDDFEAKKNAHLERLHEFSQKNSVSRSKEFDDSAELSSLDEFYILNYRRLTEMRRKLAAAKRASPAKEQQKQQDSQGYEENKSIASGSSRSFRSIHFEGHGGAQSSSSSSRVAASKQDVPASYRVGELPKYLKVMNERKAEQRRIEGEIDPNCPAGHVALSEQERVEALEIANQSYQNLIDELNKMPLTSQTLKIRHRKMEIDKELDHMEESIRIFSRLKVYVKIDE